ncbi:MAG: VWA domain-containing protein [Gammaproteobacteria bacterium]|nr:VWA domain-containing protein [Gammaproteobacteria bacterium]
MKPNRRNPGSLLAFLDVMACGLGAIVLLFLIVKHNTSIGASQTVDSESTLVQAEVLSMLNREKARLREKIHQAASQEEDREAAENKQARDLESVQRELARLNRAIRQEQANIKALQDEIVLMKPPQKAGPGEDTRVGEEEYLLGMKVEGPRIAILIDRSASMTDEVLVDIIARKIRPDSEKQQGPKWQRAKRTVRWLLNRLPSTSEVAVIAFNDEAEFLRRRGWESSQGEEVVQHWFDELDDLVPTGATNLEAGIDALKQLSPPATNVYIVTDGLPTQGKTPPGRFSACKTGRQVVSGECRLKIFEQATHRFFATSAPKTNVILLPLEGDPQAAPAYWQWTAFTAGLLLVPASDWP